MGQRAVGVETAVAATRFTDVLRVPVFAVLYAAETQSILGDQLARVALSVLVFQRTGSAVATALTYAATYLPAILGGFLLSGIGDHVPRRLVMIGCDVLRIGLFAVMSLDGVSTGALIGLLVLAVLLGPAFAASEVSYLAAALSPAHFRIGTGLRMISNQLAQVLGFAVGGALVAGLGPRGALLLNAATYAVSALLVTFALRPGQAAAPRGPAVVEPPDPTRSLLSVLWRDRQVRALLMMSCLAGLFVVPEGLAVPFGRATGASTAQTGLLLASIPLGSAVGAAWLVRMVADRRRAGVAHWMAVGCGLPLVLTGDRPALAGGVRPVGRLRRPGRVPGRAVPDDRPGHPGSAPVAGRRGGELPAARRPGPRADPGRRGGAAGPGGRVHRSGRRPGQCRGPATGPGAPAAAGWPGRGPTPGFAADDDLPCDVAVAAWRHGCCARPPRPLSAGRHRSNDAAV